MSFCQNGPLTDPPKKGNSRRKQRRIDKKMRKEHEEKDKEKIRSKYEGMSTEELMRIKAEKGL